ncbi:PREDICTED: sorting nexin-14 isoform X1 [Hipposideros armiger]|uniref:Sorting nexin-14 isoform X1 n=1 Tax=Hipposideros armiger TaxID=186990 RepID=A0A8B7S3Y2_HIPAR|nr:PREDICTED: sorting nexin-14 isoform X1 [Hipposideros armiger]
MGIVSISASVCSAASATPAEMVPWVRAMGEKLKQRLRLDVGREICRQYPLFCFLLLCLSAASLLLNRYLHVLMIFWSFVAGVVTFYCSLGPDSLLPNIFFTIKYKPKQFGLQELFPQGRSCAVCGKVKCKRHRPSLLLENYQPWLDLKISSKVDASLSEVLELVLENFVYPWYRDVTDDESFVDELRITLRFFASVLIRRIHKVDIPSIITKKLLKAAMKHIEVIVKASKKEEFNDRILRPELSNDEMLSLHEELQKIYKTYCLDESIDKIRFDPFIVEEIQKIAEGPYIDVVKLQTMRCLFEAYEHVLSLLENVFTPMFCHSDEYFRQLLRGAESPTRNSKFNRGSLSLDDFRSTQKRGESFGISRIGSKIKGVFKSTTMEGAMLPNYGLAEGEDDFIEEGIVVMEDDSPVEAVSTPNTPRNLAAWKISIPYVDFFEDPSSERKEKKERIPVFCIDVERNDRRAVGHEPEHWSVYRRYLEFYVLESKLTEFHGAFPDAQLPSKRIIGPKNYEFLKSKREEFQEYLQKLLQHPELSNSQLLADFLSPNGGETQFLDKILPDVNLGKIIKSVPGKLMKEKGQHLEPFIMNFINSCESPKPKPSKPELTILSPTSENNKKLYNDLFKNNANRAENAERKQNQNYFMEMMTVEGIYDYLMYVGRVVFQVPDWLHHFLMGTRILFKNTLEMYTDYYLHCKLEQLFQEHRLVSLITLLRDAVFCENTEPRSLQDKQKRAKQTFEEMMNYIPDLIVKCIGEESKYERIRLLFDGLQQPVLNKQLTYVLLDIVIQELFPELNKVQKEVTSVTSWM